MYDWYRQELSDLHMSLLRKCLSLRVATVSIKHRRISDMMSGPTYDSQVAVTRCNHSECVDNIQCQGEVVDEKSQKPCTLTVEDSAQVDTILPGSIDSLVPFPNLYSYPSQESALVPSQSFEKNTVDVGSDCVFPLNQEEFSSNSINCESESNLVDMDTSNKEEIVNVVADPGFLTFDFHGSSNDNIVLTQCTYEDSSITQILGM